MNLQIPRSNEPLIAFFGSLGFLLAEGCLHVRLVGIGPGTFIRRDRHRARRS